MPFKLNGCSLMFKYSFLYNSKQNRILILLPKNYCLFKDLYSFDMFLQFKVILKQKPIKCIPELNINSSYLYETLLNNCTKYFDDIDPNLIKSERKLNINRIKTFLSMNNHPYSEEMDCRCVQEKLKFCPLHYYYDKDSFQFKPIEHNYNLRYTSPLQIKRYHNEVGKSPLQITRYNQIGRYKKIYVF